MRKTMLSFFMIFSLFMCGCKDEVHERFEIPAWVEGSIWEKLENSGNYSIFLSGIEKIGYKRALEAKGLYTVMVPGDDAFEKYFQDNNYGSLDDLPNEDLKLLMLGHVFKYSHPNGESLVAFNKMGAGFEGEGFQSVHFVMAMKTPSIEIDPEGKSRGVYYGTKLVACYDEKKLGDDPKFNYETMFSGTTYEDDSYYVENARILEEPNTAVNGYIYPVDRVIEPKYRAEEILAENNPLVKTLYDGFLKYDYSKKWSDVYGGTVGVDSLFIKSYYGLPNISTDDLTYDRNVVDVARTALGATLIVPNDESLNEYLQNKFLDIYGDIESIPFFTTRLLLKSFQVLTGGDPISLQDGTAKNLHGELLKLDMENDIEYIKHASNAIVYGTKKVLETNIFDGVPGPTLIQPDIYNASVFLHYTDYLYSLMSPDVEYTLFIPTNEAIEEDGQYTIDWDELKKDNRQFILDGDGEVAPANQVNDYISGHIVIGKFELGSEPVFMNTMRAYHVIKLSDNKIYNGDDLPEEFVPAIDKTYSVNNGISYRVNKIIQSPGDNDVIGIIQTRFPAFYAKMQAAGIAGGAGWTNFAGGNILNVFPPTDAALAQAETDGLIPQDTDELKEFLSYFFVSLNQNEMSNYFLPAYEYLNTSVKTLCVDEENSGPETGTVYCKIKFNGDRTNLTISNNDNTGSANILNDQIYIGTDGVVEGMDDIIIYSKN